MLKREIPRLACCCRCEEVIELTAPFADHTGLTGTGGYGHFMLDLDGDATQIPARTRIEMTLTSLQLAQMPHKAELPPYEGSLWLDQMLREGVTCTPTAT